MPSWPISPELRGAAAGTVERDPEFEPPSTWILDAELQEASLLQWDRALLIAHVRSPLARWALFWGGMTTILVLWPQTHMRTRNAILGLRAEKQGRRRGGARLP